MGDAAIQSADIGGHLQPLTEDYKNLHPRYRLYYSTLLYAVPSFPPPQSFLPVLECPVAKSEIRISKSETSTNDRMTKTGRNPFSILSSDSSAPTGPIVMRSLRPRFGVASCGAFGLERAKVGSHAVKSDTAGNSVESSKTCRARRTRDARPNWACRCWRARQYSVEGPDIACYNHANS